MFDIRRFRQLLYSVILLGILGYSIALESAPHFVVGSALVLAYAWVNRGGRLLAIPRWVASLAALVSGIWTAYSVQQSTMTPFMAISQWLFVLLLVTLWSRPNNRGYGQMLVMSLVLMVAGAINTANVIYGVLLIAYLFLTLYCCLLFHLKVETEQAFKAYNLSPDKVNAHAVQHNQGHFTRSMRRLTGLVSIVSVTLGVAVFLFFPRTRAPGMLMQMQTSQSAPLTGFSDRVSFEQVARIQQNPEVVAHVTVTENGRELRGEDLYLRGLALDVYTGEVPGRQNMSWQWVRRQPLPSQTTAALQLRAGLARNLVQTTARRQITQRVFLQPTGTASLFGLAGVVSMQADRDMELQYGPADGSLRTLEPLRVPIHYELVSSGQLPVFQESEALAERYASFLAPQVRSSPEFMRRSRIDPRIREYAMRPEVGGADENGPLAAQRGEAAEPQAIDETIATNIARHLRGSFKYTLDLTDAKRRRGEDPLVSFLYDYQRGHCEYFAGAMALMCQSLGMDARVVVGFRTGPEDYNPIAGYYVVRQSNAHAWVEVLTPEGWKMYDPTTANIYVRPYGNGFFRRMRDLFDYVQYKWATSVVTYGDQNRLNLMRSLDSFFSSLAAEARSLVEEGRSYLHSENAYRVSSRLIGGALVLAVLLLIAAVGVFAYERRRLLRRAERIGMSALPAGEQLRLARQLGFYDELLQLLAQRRMHRAPSQTPEEFAQSLDDLPPEAYWQVQRLTRLFYRIRYGDKHLTTTQRRRLSTTIDQLTRTLTRAS